MRNLAMVLIAAMALLTLGSTSAEATPTGIGLSTPPGAFSFSTITFRGNGSLINTVTVSLSSSCCGSSISGSAFGIGAITDTGFYQISPGPITLTLINPSTGVWSVTGAPMSFCFSSLLNCNGTHFLAGNLTFVNFQQAPSGIPGEFSHLAFFDVQLSLFPPIVPAALNLTGATGTEVAQGLWPGGLGMLGFSIESGSSSWVIGGVQGLRGTNNFISVQGDFEGFVAPVPEPGTAGLLGTGLVVLGGWMRRRRRV